VVEHRSKAKATESFTFLTKRRGKPALQPRRNAVTVVATMAVSKKFPMRFLSLCLLPLWLAGCTTQTITNLTPSKMERNPDGIYPFEAAWDSNQQSLLKDTIQGYVIIGLETYPMERVPKMEDRWEAFVPIPDEEDYVNYRFKFDYEYLGIPIRRSNSVLTRQFQLEIVD
jgi:hypothetical protein